MLSLPVNRSKTKRDRDTLIYSRREVKGRQEGRETQLELLVQRRVLGSYFQTTRLMRLSIHVPVK